MRNLAADLFCLLWLLKRSCRVPYLHVHPRRNKLEGASECETVDFFIIFIYISARPWRPWRVCYCVRWTHSCHLSISGHKCRMAFYMRAKNVYAIRFCSSWLLFIILSAIACTSLGHVESIHTLCGARTNRQNRILFMDTVEEENRW